MHIALVSPAWPLGAHPNGIVTYVHHMRRGLLTQGHRVTVLSGNIAKGSHGPDSVQLPTESLLSRLVDRGLRRRKTVYDAWKPIARAVNYVDRRCPIDVVEMEESFGWVGNVAANVRPVVVCKLHGPGFLTLMDEVATEHGQRRVEAEGRALATLPFITAPSRWTLSQTLSRYHLCPDIGRVVGNPIGAGNDLPLWDSSRRDADQVLFVGRFDKVKGADLVLRAMAILGRRRPHLRLTFVGPDAGLLQPDGSRVTLAEFMRSLNDPSLELRIDYLGPLRHAEIQALRSRSAVTVVASRQESQGYTAMEAMLQACPLVCTDSSGLSELVEDEVTGLKAVSEDVEDLAAQIERLLRDPELSRRLGKTAREYVVTRHSPGAIAAQTLDVYERAIQFRR